ncbi:MAG: hypothetical protein KDK30_16645, partial [Leptospiraceae bacterium]|nr:hypothetical protein [Leptospiraceae bacterium]
AVSCPVPDEMKKDVDMQRPARWVCEWIRANYTHMKPRIVYNVNYPEEKGVSIDATFPDVRYTYQGTRRYHDQYAVLSEDGSERTIQLKTLQLDHLRSDHSDFEAIMENCISVTPLSTYTTHISELKEWFHRTLNESA